MKRRTMKKYRTYVYLHIILAAYSLLGICSKFAAREKFLSSKFIMFYGIVVVNLFLYAICWQQIIKRMPLVTAYANKAVTVIWGLVLGRLVFGESIKPQKVIGTIVIIVGIVLVIKGDEPALESKED